jgi:tripartite-type tricarboxylate transporter receptor subunit TctC
MRRRSLLAAPLLAPALAAAQAWPDRPLRMIVPFPPAGPTDAFARRLAARLSMQLGQTVVIENRAGAGGAIGTLEAVRARPDGYSFLFATASTLALYPLLAERPQFDALRDLLPVAIPGAATVAFAARPEVAETLPALVTAARARPGALHYGSPGTGTYLHLAFELFKHEAAQFSPIGGAAPVEIVHVPYRGAGPAMADLLGGHLQAVTDSLATSLEHHRSGRIRMLAVCSAQRSPLVPEVPTVAEALGLPSFEAALWLGVALPLGTPEPIRARLAEAVGGAMADATFRAELAESGFEIGSALIPARAQNYMAAEVAKWRPIVAATGAKLE